ncbi:hypothetical protein ACOMHN_033336 [Nucella lapillus]
MTRTKANQSLTQCSGPKDTTISLTSGEVVDVWINKDVFRSSGDVKKEQEFTEVDNTGLLSFKWPAEVKLASTIQWTPQITTRSPERKREFAQSTVEELGCNQWEVVKHVVESCCKRFGGYLLGVSFWGVRVGFKDKRAMDRAESKAEAVIGDLVCLFADTEYLFRDVMVSWSSSVSYLQDVDIPVPVQETSSTTSKVLPGGSSVATDGPSFSKGSSGERQQLDRVGADRRDILLEVLAEVQEVKQSVHRLEGKVDANREVCQRLEESICGGRTDLSQSNTDLGPPGQAYTFTENSPRQNAAGHSSPSPRADHQEPRRQDRERPRTHPGTAQGTSPRLPQQRQGRQHTPQTRHNNHVSPDNDNNTENRFPASGNSSEQQSMRNPQKPRSRDNSLNRTVGNSLITGDDNTAKRGGRKANIKEDVKNNSHKESDSSQRSAREDSTRMAPAPQRNSDNHGQTTPSANTSSNTSSNTFQPSPVTSRSSHHQGSQSTSHQQWQRPSGNPQESPSTSQQNKPTGKQGSLPTSQQPSSRRHQESPSTSQQQQPTSGKQSTSAFSASRQEEKAIPGSPSSARHQPRGGPGGRESQNTQGKSHRNSQGQHTKSESQDQVKLLVDSSYEAKLVRASVERAYEQDKVKPPKAKSFDTMLCLDISESMKEGGAFDQMKNIVLQFIEGVEDIVTSFGVEENMGLVTFGGRANVVQNLTNDFNLIRDQIDLLQLGGKSPFMEGLLVAMAAFVRKGGAVSISGEWKVRPRVIFISDGHPTESAESQTDIAGNLQNVRMSLFNLLVSYKKDDKSNKVHPIVFIPVGEKADKHYMEVMSTMCDGVYLEPDKVQQLCHYFRVQETIGKVLVTLRRGTQDLSPQKLDATMVALTPDLREAEKQEVKEVVLRELANPNRVRSRHVKPNDMDYVFENTEKVMEGKRLPLGTRVIRGPDWSHGNQDRGGPGTVIHHHESRTVELKWREKEKENIIVISIIIVNVIMMVLLDSVHWVNWDHGDFNCYGYSANRGYQIFQTKDHPRLRQGNEPLEIGMTVKKGKDWTPMEGGKEQGEGQGVIIRKFSAKVMVRWSNAVIQVCRYAPGLQEVDYCAPDGDEDNTGRPSTSRSYLATPDSSDSMTTTFEGKGQWQWCDENNTWHSYDAATNTQLEEVCKNNPRMCIIVRDEKNRRIMFRKSVEKAVDDGYECKVRRIQKETEH